MARTSCCDKTGLKKGTWTAEEDKKLVAYITRYGCWNWRQLPKFAGLSRCGKSCRLRWMNYLRPNIKRGNFSKEEDDTIIKLHDSLGKKWSAIAAQLPGRTDNEIKNHWHTYLKKRFRQNSIPQGKKLSSNNRNKPKNVGKKMSDQFQNSVVEPSTDHKIVESFQFPPSEMSSELCSNSISFEDYGAVSLSPIEMFAESAGSFWTEPFLADNYDATYVVPPFEDTGFLSPDYQVICDEFLCPYGFYDEFVTMF